MLRQEELAEVIDSQREHFLTKNQGLKRKSLKDIPIIGSYATIITGLRRCGKSTLLLQLLHQRYQDALYLNFEDIRLVNFETGDFARLHKELKRRNLTVVFLDEIQLIKKWELFINQLLREEFTVFVTGSNASLLSRELGTHLTGRQVSMELFPFSYKEFLEFIQKAPSVDSLADYLKLGGIPEYVKSQNELIVNSLVDDILVKDISIRHSVRDVASLKQLALYLISQIGSPISANKITGLFGIKSSATILDFFSYFRDAYLIDLVPNFSYSLKAQSRNPKKVYAIDTGIISAVSIAFSDNLGRRLENVVFLHLRRKYSTIYYFTEKGECDFIVFQNGKVKHAVQVCFYINDENFEREYQGLFKALKFFKLDYGVIVTTDQRDRFEGDGIVIELVPAFEFLTIEF